MKILFDLVLIGVIFVTLLFVYQEYGDDIRGTFSDTQTMFTIYIDTATVNVTLADTEKERVQGLSGVQELPDLEGKLFVFDDEQKHGIWMKDMNFPIDIMWFDNNLKLVHIEEDVSPDTYPTIFVPQTPARFVVEVNANLVNSLNIQYGDALILPSSILPKDIRNNLQQ